MGLEAASLVPTAFGPMASAGSSQQRVPSTHPVLHRQGCHCVQPAQPLSYVTNLCTAQACRRTSSDLRSQTPQQAHQTSHYPLYGTSAAATTTAAGCLDGLPRYTRCLSACTHTSKNEKIPVLPGKRAASRIYSSPIRPQHSPSGLHVYPSANINVLAYLDDLIVWDTSIGACQRAILRTATVLQEHGFLIHRTKSQPTPSQLKDWLGFRWDSQIPAASLAPANRDKIRSHCRLILQKGNITYPEAESLQGRLAFAAQLLPRLRYLKRSLTSLMRPLPRSGASVEINEKLQTLLKTWAFTDALEEKGLLRPPPASNTVWTDASRQGWGFHDLDGNAKCGTWSEQQKKLHINALELLTIKFALNSDLVKRGQCVAVFTDNCAAYFACLKQGSIRAPLMHDLYGDILKVLQKKDLILLSRRIPGIRNVLADALSRSYPVATEWELDDRDFRRIQRWAGPLQVDLMATPFNTKLPTFVCPFLHPKAAAVDALTTSWNTWQAAYLFPPSIMIDHLLPQIQAFRGTLVLVLSPQASTIRRTQLQSWAKDSLQLRFPPSQKVGDRMHIAPFSPSAPWIALRICEPPS